MSEFIAAFGLLIIIIVSIAFLTKMLRQPIIVGYVLSGLLFSYLFSANEGVHDQITLLSLIGITLLLFLMGFEFDFRMFRAIGKDLTLLALLQTVGLAIVGLSLTLLFPYTMMERIYLSIAFVLSSTLISAKNIENKKETGSLHGKITLGLLVFQDVIAIAAMTFITVSTNNWANTILSYIHLSPELALVKYLVSPLFGFLLLFAFAFLMSRYVLNFVLKVASRSSELLLITGMSVCFIFAEIAIKLGYSDGIGAFIGGVVIANTIYKGDISSRLKPLVTFFTMLFFVGLGFQISFDITAQILIMAGLFIAASIIIKPIIVYVSMRLLKYDLKTSFLTSLNLTPLSEFCIIFVTGGVVAKQIDTSLLSIIIISTLSTMILSTYLLKYDKDLWRVMQPFLSFADRFIVKDRSEQKVETLDANVVIFGYYESGKEILETLRAKNKKIVVISNDPDHIDKLEEQGIPHYYGSPVTPDFFEQIHFSDLQLVVSSLTDKDESKFLLKHIKQDYPGTVMIVTSRDVKDAMDLYKNEADYVIYPTYVNEKQVSVLLEEYTSDVSSVIQKKMNDMSKFQEILDDKYRLRQKRKYILTNSFFHDVDHLVGKLGEFQKVNERTIFHLFNRHERAEKRIKKQSEEREKK